MLKTHKSPDKTPTHKQENTPAHAPKHTLA